MENLANFLASDNALVAGFLSVIFAMFMYYLNKIDKQIDNLRKQIEESAKHRTNDQNAINARFDAVNARFDAVHERFDKMNDKIEGVNENLSKKIDGVQENLGNTTERVARIEGYLEMLNRKNKDIHGYKQMPLVQDNRHDVAADTAEPNVNPDGQPGAPGKDDELAYQRPPDRGSQQNLAAGVAEPPPNNTEIS